MTLNKIHKNSAFKVPKVYFENFDVAFFNELELKNQVKESGFKTPDDYLDEFNASIPRTLKSNNSRKINKKYSFYISGIAAALVLLFMFSLPREEIQEISLETIENYLINEEDQSEALSNILTLEDLNDVSTLEVSYSEIENYILQNASVETLLID
tara:strand:+ start:595 stop:1062 length:468 start_codon:yes stop_codon:yes gene_type:complete